MYSLIQRELTNIFSNLGARRCPTASLRVELGQHEGRGLDL